MQSNKQINNKRGGEEGGEGGGGGGGGGRINILAFQNDAMKWRKKEIPFTDNYR